MPYVYSDVMQKTIFLSNDYFELENLRKLFAFKNGIIKQKISLQDSLVLDIGANIGNHTVYFAKEMDAKHIISFEPIPETFRILKKNIILNNIEGIVEAHCCGVSDQEEMFPLPSYCYDNTGGMSLIQELNNQDVAILFTDPAEVVNCHTVDSYGFTNVALVKIDVEGMELKVLCGAKQTIMKWRPYIVIESFPDRYPEVCGWMTRHGYRKTTINEYCCDYLFYPC